MKCEGSSMEWRSVLTALPNLPKLANCYQAAGRGWGLRTVRISKWWYPGAAH